jgi:hypothetical protein
MKTLIADLMLLSLASGPVFAKSSPFRRGPWSIYNGFDYQPTQQDLPPAALRDEGHVTPSQRTSTKSSRPAGRAEIQVSYQERLRTYKDASALIALEGVSK